MGLFGGLAARMMQWLGRDEGGGLDRDPPATSGLDDLHMPQGAQDHDPVDKVQDSDNPRRAGRSEAWIAAHGLRPAPLIPTDHGADTVLRPRDEVIERLCGLTLVAAKALAMIGPGGLKSLLEELEARYDPGRLLTPSERSFIDDPVPTFEQRVEFAWRAESAHALLWALGRIADWPPADEPADIELLLEHARASSELPDHGVRPLREMLDEYDLALRAYWTVGLAKATGEAVPLAFDLDLLSERHYALAWLTHDLPWRDPPHPGLEWDAAACDNPRPENPDWIITPAGEEWDEREFWTVEQASRKQRSERLLRERGLPVNPWMPPAPDAQEVALRHPHEVAYRVVVLTLLGAKAIELNSGVPFDDVQSRVEGMIELMHLEEAFTPEERAFIEDPDPSESDLRHFGWRLESSWLLFWALGLVESPIGLPYFRVDYRAHSEIFARHLKEPGLELRPIAEILDEYDLTLRCYWPAQYFRANGIRQPRGYDRDVLIERHHSLQWLIYGGDWDDWSGEQVGGASE